MTYQPNHPASPSPRLSAPEPWQRGSKLPSAHLHPPQLPSGVKESRKELKAGAIKAGQGRSRATKARVRTWGRRAPPPLGSKPGRKRGRYPGWRKWEGAAKEGTLSESPAPQHTQQVILPPEAGLCSSLSRSREVMPSRRMGFPALLSYPASRSGLGSSGKRSI